MKPLNNLQFKYFLIYFQRHTLTVCRFSFASYLKLKQYESNRNKHFKSNRKNSPAI